MLPGPEQCYLVQDNGTWSQTLLQGPDIQLLGQLYLIMDNTIWSRTFTWSMTTQSGPGQYYLVLSSCPSQEGIRYEIKSVQEDPI